MTLIIGIKCQDGVVLGADGAATFGAFGQMTIRQPVKNKLKIDGQLVVGVSGPVGLGQRIAGEISKLWGKGIFSNNNAVDALTAARESIVPHIERETNIARFFAQSIPSAMQNALIAGVVAVPIKLEPHLFSFDYQGAPELATPDLPFIAIGSGQMLAEPFLAFVRRVFWDDGVPTVDQGVFAAVWALHHAIKSAAGMIGLPIQIVTMRKDAKGSPVVKQVSGDRWEEQLQAIEAFDRRLPQLFQEVVGLAEKGEASRPPSPPVAAKAN